MLHEMDEFIEEQLIPQYTKGKKRQENPENRRLRVKAWELRKKGNYQEATKLHQEYTRIPSTQTRDPNYRRLRYVRYADDFLLGLIGTKKEAEAIKQEIKNYLETVG